jgi:arginase family enzyme
MDLVALDLVEVAPDWDIGNITALAAVKIIFETLGAYFISEETKEKQSSSET